MMIGNNQEYLFLFKLTSLYEALCASADSVVSVPSSLSEVSYESAMRQPLFTTVVYTDSENPEEARRTVAERRAFAEGNIARHFDYFDEACEGYAQIEEALGGGDVGAVARVARELTDLLQNYGHLVSSHRIRNRGLAFLNYPCLYGGRVFDILGYDLRQRLEFNPRGNDDGMFQDLETIFSIALELPKEVVDLPKMNFGVDLRKGVECACEGSLFMKIRKAKKLYNELSCAVF